MDSRAVFWQNARHRGFTIVELLIVITVISVLATIVIVAYGSVQNNARDGAVQSDLRKMADRMEEFRLGKGAYPAATQTDLEDLVAVTKDAYIQDSPSGSLSYCRNDNDFTIMGRSASKNAFIFSSKDGLKAASFTGNLNNPDGQCDRGGVTPGSDGYSSIWLLKGTGNPDGYGWQPWIN